MNTNSNTYTVIYTTVVVVIVAAVLAFVSLRLGPAQQSNEKAETLRQMMAAAKVADTDRLYASRNAEVLSLYCENIDSAYTVDLNGTRLRSLSVNRDDIELLSSFKPIDKAIKAGTGAELPVYVFKGGVSVVPVYGAGLWGPVWGYIALEPDGRTIRGAYFDHGSETPGLGAKIKDEPWFREKFIGRKVAFGQTPVFNLSKNAEATGSDNSVDAITGATMTSKGLNAALNVWLGAYGNCFKAAAAEPETKAAAETETKTTEE